VEPEEPGERLSREVDRHARRRRQAEEDHATLLGQTVYLGSLGLLFVLPVVGGAYLGLWLDERYPGYSQSWTISLIVVGVIVGAVNVYLFLRE
jgi:ATP synthase protein I